MSAKSIALNKLWAAERGMTFPPSGPKLPIGWVWVVTVPRKAPTRAEHEHGPLHIKQRKNRIWTAHVQGFTLREKDGLFVLAAHRGKRGLSPADGAVAEFLFPDQAAEAAVAFATGARVKCT